MIRAPKQAFIESPHRAQHEKIVQTESFQSACDYSLLVLLNELPKATDPSQGWDCHSQMIGARRVLDILKTIHKADEGNKPLRAPKLNYNV